MIEPINAVLHPPMVFHLREKFRQLGQVRLDVLQQFCVASGTESARLIFHARLPCNLGDLVLRNKIANLAQEVKSATCWFDAFFLFSPLPCGRLEPLSLELQSLSCR